MNFVSSTMSTSRSSVLQLYKALMRESKKFSGYNYREYALRRTKDAFRENKSKTDPGEIEKLFKSGKENLEIIKRQVIIGQLYGQPKIVIEKGR